MPDPTAAVTPTAVYNSGPNGAIPFGGLTVYVYRGVTPLGAYILESAAPSQAGVLTKRPGADGGANGWWLVNGDVEGSAVLQRDIATTPTLRNGDFFLAPLRTPADGSAVVPVSEKWVIHSPSNDIGMTEYRKQSCSIICDLTYAPTMA